MPIGGDRLLPPFGGRPLADLRGQQADDLRNLVGEGVARRARMSRDLGHQRGGRAAGARAIAMPGRQIIADGGLEPRIVFQIGAQPLLAPAERMEQHRADQILLRFEMSIEGAVGQARRAHDAGKTDRGDAAFAKLRRGDIDDVLARGFLVSLFVAHRPILRTAILAQSAGRHKIVRNPPIELQL